MRTAQEMEFKLAQEEEDCNDTMKALWEECKPCLKNTCVKYYSRTCSSGSGLVGRQVRPCHAHIYTHSVLILQYITCMGHIFQVLAGKVMFY